MRTSQPTGPLLAEALEAALLLVGFLAASGVAHEPEAAGGVDLQAGPGLEDWETRSGGDWEWRRLGVEETGRLGEEGTGRWIGSPESHGPLAKRLSQSAHHPPGRWSRELK